MLKAPFHILLFKGNAPGVNLPPQPIITHGHREMPHLTTVNIL